MCIQRRVAANHPVDGGDWPVLDRGRTGTGMMMPRTGPRRSSPSPAATTATIDDCFSDFVAGRVEDRLRAVSSFTEPAVFGTGSWPVLRGALLRYGSV